MELGIEALLELDSNNESDPVVDLLQEIRNTPATPIELPDDIKEAMVSDEELELIDSIMEESEDMQALNEEMELLGLLEE